MHPISHTLRAVLMTILLSGLFVSCNKANEEATPKSASDLIQEDNSFSLLRAAVLRANFADALKGASLTIFAPNDDAFKAAGFADVASINALPIATIEQVLKYHVFNGLVKSDAPQLGTNTPVQSIGGGTAYITKTVSGSTAGVTINGARVIKADQAVANGIVHTIDRVLLPSAPSILSALQSDPANFSLIVAAINRVPSLAVQLSSTLAAGQPVTIFVPDNAAFAATGSPLANLAAINAASLTTLSSVLGYHATSGLTFSNQLVAGQLTTLNPTSAKLTVVITTNTPTIKGNQNTTAATIKRADVVANNGLIHVVSQVLRP
ncbi:MAG: fasciclin domain-containing protein [Rudanella sp.]|nr:fasciclin domain-containing protein [Rudanella sp.]